VLIISETFDEKKQYACGPDRVIGLFLVFCLVPSIAIDTLKKDFCIYRVI
jgi:hypothetical protein